MTFSLLSQNRNSLDSRCGKYQHFITKMERATGDFLQCRFSWPSRHSMGCVVRHHYCFMSFFFGSLPLCSHPLLRLCLLPASLLSEQSCKKRSGVKRGEVTEVPEEETPNLIQSAAAEVLLSSWVLFFVFFLITAIINCTR